MAAANAGYVCFNESDSELSSPPSRLSTPESFVKPLCERSQLPTPPRSQESSQTGSPCPDDSSAMNSDKDGPPPRKKRRVSERPPRTTEYLDLRRDEIDPEEQPQLDRLLNVLHKRQKIVVVAGAGISVSAGIPDFRSSTGLFKTLRAQHNLKGSGKDLFDASVVYKDASSTSSFHDMVREMSKMTKVAQPTPFHHMLATLAQQDRLLRLYSQNVDGIDTALEPLKTRIPLAKDEFGKWPKTVQLHGGLDKMVCSKCHDTKEFESDLFDGPVPPVCAKCEQLNHVRTEVAGKRSHGVGMLRPRMVLYNEHNPDDEAIGRVCREDLRKRPDAIIVVGTTLKVPGVKRIVREMCATVRDRKDGVAIWINNDPEPSGKEFEDCWDIIVRGKCDSIARHAALGQWDRQQDSEVMSTPSSRKGDVKVLINHNPTFKQPESVDRPMTSPLRPNSTPLTSRRNSVMPVSFVKDSFDDEDSTILETPSKKRSRAPSKSTRNTPTKAPTKAAVKNLTEMFTKAKPPATGEEGTTAAKKPTRATRAKPKTAAGGKKPTTAASKKQAAAAATAAAKPQPTLKFTAKKPVSTRASNKKSKDAIVVGGLPHPAAAAMLPIPPEDARNNSPMRNNIILTTTSKAEEGVCV